jgi:hypothetical protein
MQPYEHLRAGMLADTSGSRTPSFPVQTSAALDVMAGGFVAQAPAPPTFARPYDLVSTYAASTPPVPVAAAGAATAAPQVVGTTGRTVATNWPVTTAIPPKGVNNAWIEYNGSRWIADGKAIARTAELQEIGQYRGFPVYARGTDRSTIYVPSTADRLVPYIRK